MRFETSIQTRMMQTNWCCYSPLEIWFFSHSRSPIQKRAKRPTQRSKAYHRIPKVRETVCEKE
jgi:hypothetical protein